ncbi:MAG: TIGR04283 family arsenosugar biosynthesis glycosyltransferase [Rhodospirillales bacterium]
MLSVIIPVLNGETTLPAALESLKAWPEAPDAPEAPGVTPGTIEIIAADGGSTDATRTIAERMGARVIETRRGRGVQLCAGAAAARGDWFLFLHADTVLAADWPQAARRLMAEDEDAAGYFRFRLDGDADAARRMAIGVAWRSRVLALPYGDQGLLISRALYDRVGGFKPIPLMEDVDLIGRIGPARLRALDADAVTSSVRYQKTGYVRRITINIVCLALYTFGMPTALINRFYR